MATIGENLCLDFALEDLLALLAPRAGLAQARKKGAGNENARGLSHQMIVGLRAPRVFARDFPKVAINHRDKSLTKRLRYAIRGRNQLQGDHPIDQPNRQLHRATPIHTQAEWALTNPPVDVLDHLAGIPLVAAQPIRATQHNQMMMSIRFPNELGITRHRSISIIHPRGKPNRRFDLQGDISILSTKWRDKIVTELKQLGFAYVTLDLVGYRTGSMNEVLDKEVLQQDK